MTQLPAAPPEPGWHYNSAGQRQWWNGSSWGPLASHQPPMRTPSAPLKTRTTAYLLALFLGGVGGHRFYLRKLGTAWMMLIANVISWLYFLDPDPASKIISNMILAVLALCILIDLFRIPSMVDEFNREN